MAFREERFRHLTNIVRVYAQELGIWNQSHISATGRLLEIQSLSFRYPG
jgi:hypothetical protein